MDILHDLIKQHVLDEPISNQMYSVEQFEGNFGSEKVPSFVLFNIPGLKKFIQSRSNSVYNQLCQLNWSCANGGKYSNNDNAISIYPNPSYDNITIKFDVASNSPYFDFKIYNSSGKNVLNYFSENLAGEDSKTISISNLPSGLYILKTIYGE
jgi:hypothetical protein